MNKPVFLDNIRIVLSHTTHPGNIGGAARAMKTMGLSRLALVSPKCFPDPQAEAMASGAVDVLEEAAVCATLDEALAGTVLAVGLTARRRDLSHSMLTVREAAPQIMEAAAQAPVAVVLGTEMSGLTNSELDRCQLLATIPANPDYSSLNLAAAVQIVAYELRQALPELPLPAETPRELASFEEIEHFYRHLEQTLLATGFLNPKQPGRLMQRLRRLFARARLEKEEVNILRGILAARNNN
ncbi:MAG: RNA methyltransferase [Pseudomonadota bacterium]